MIEKFQYFSSNGIFLDVNLDINSKEDYLFKNNPETEISKFYQAQSSGIKWIFNQKTITIHRKNTIISGYPFPNLEKVLIIYHNKALIYSQDGKLLLEINPPDTYLSDLAKKMRNKLYFNSYSIYFPAWIKKNNHLIMQIQINYNQNWYELRELDCETGSLGNVTGEGMR